MPGDARLPDYPQNLPDWNALTPEQKDLEDLRMSVYAAMVERMDQGIGRLMKALESSGKADNTLIMFMSDNGADSFSVMDQSLLEQGKLPGDRGSNWQLGTGWAYASVTPWRLYKISQHSGGVTTGAIVWWPGGAIDKPGRIDRTPVHMVDVMPTVLAVANLPPAEGTLAGESLRPLLADPAWRRKSPMFFQYLDNRAIRTSGWTLAEVDGTGWELYRPAHDPFENHNVAAEHPEVVADLAARWLGWWRQQSAKPGYTPESANSGPHYKPQGDRGSGVPYVPSAMPAKLSKRYPMQ